MRARALLAAALCAAAVAGCGGRGGVRVAEAPRAEEGPMVPATFATVGAWTARSAEGPVRIELMPDDAAALVRAFRAPVPILLQDGTRAGEAVAAALLPDGRLRAAARLSPEGMRAFSDGARELDASFEAEVRGGALVPVAVESFRLAEKSRWTR